jgi:hypothetical protein
MTWGRGLFRVWLVLAVVWCSVAAYTTYIDCNWYRPRALCFDDFIPFALDKRLLWILVPPALVLLTGVTLRWCIAGFIVPPSK